MGIYNVYSKNNNPGIKSLHLIISVIFIIPAALAYGLYPNLILYKLFGFKVDNTNLTNIFRAMMGLYLAMSAIWTTGIFKQKFWYMATITNIVFMAGLALGRLLSLALDGWPSEYFLTGLIVESALALWGLKNLARYR